MALLKCRDRLLAEAERLAAWIKKNQPSISAGLKGGLAGCSGAQSLRGAVEAIKQQIQMQAFGYHLVGPRLKSIAPIKVMIVATSVQTIPMDAMTTRMLDPDTW